MSIWPVYVLAAATLFSRPACTRKVRSAKPASVLRRSLVRKPGRKHGTDGALAATTRGNVPSVTGLPRPSPGYPSPGYPYFLAAPSAWAAAKRASRAETWVAAVSISEGPDHTNPKRPSASRFFQILSAFRRRKAWNPGTGAAEFSADRLRAKIP